MASLRSHSKLMSDLKLNSGSWLLCYFPHLCGKQSNSGEKGFTVVIVCHGREGVEELMAVGPAAEFPRSKQRRTELMMPSAAHLLSVVQCKPRLQDVATHIQGGSYLLNQLTLETLSG